MALSASAGMNLCLGRGTLDSDMYMKAGEFGQVGGDMSNIRHLVGSICRWVCANSMLIRGRFPDLHLIYCGVENEMPDYADRKTPDLSRGR